MKLNVIIGNQYNPYLNLAVENHLLKNNLKDEITVFLWKNHHTVVIGANQNPYAECNVQSLIDDGGYLSRRKTGGGAVYHDLGNINFSFIAHKDHYNVNLQLSVIKVALLNYGLETEISGRNDLTYEGRKFSGNAFSKDKSNCLHHGTILIKTDVDKISKYLKVKPTKLMKHGVKSVASRVVNLSEVADITSENIIPHIITAAENVYGTKANIIDFNAILNQEVYSLEKDFSSEEFLYGRWKSFNAKHSAQFSWGAVDIDISVDETTGTIENVNIATDSLNLEVIDSLCLSLKGSSSQSRPSLSIADSDLETTIVNDILDLIY